MHAAMSRRQASTASLVQRGSASICGSNRPAAPVLRSRSAINLVAAITIASTGSQATVPMGNVPPLPTGLVDDQTDPRAGMNPSGGKNTSGELLPQYGGTGNFLDDLERLTGGTRPWQPGDKAPPGSLVGANGIFGRPNTSGGFSIDIPANGSKPHETLHYPK